jgi:hypothetical protein
MVVVHKVSPHEWLYTLGDAGYHDSLTLIDVYQEEELPTSFVIEPGTWLDDLHGYANDIQMLVKWKWKPIKKKSLIA